MHATATISSIYRWGMERVTGWWNLAQNNLGEEEDSGDVGEAEEEEEEEARAEVLEEDEDVGRAPGRGAELKDVEGDELEDEGEEEPKVEKELETAPIPARRRWRRWLRDPTKMTLRKTGVLAEAQHF